MQLALQDEWSPETLINKVYGETLSITRYKGSRLNIEEPDRKKGAVFVVRTKDDLREARGVVMTSQEAVMGAIGATHWTPNVYRYGTYESKRGGTGIIKGHSEDNLRAITCFVVDVDFAEGDKPEYALFGRAFCVDLGEGREMWPSYVLDTPHGYQATYILRTPVWVRKDDQGHYPAVTAAKRVSQAIRAAVAAKEPATDTGANHFGFFRMPGANNIVDAGDDVADFGQLLRWAHRVNGKAMQPSRRPSVVTDQANSSWFQALAAAKVPCARKSGYGRNNTLLTLCLAMYSSGKGEVAAYDFADEWNSRQDEPLRDREVRAIVRSAYSGRYKGASTTYIKELVARYAPEAKVVTAHAWMHLRKAREDRTYSHAGEWMHDVLQAVQASTDRVRGAAHFTTRQLRAELGISAQSLNKLLDRLQEAALVSVRRVRGRAGGVYVATAKMMADYLAQAKGEAREQLLAGCSERMRRAVRLVADVQADGKDAEEIDLFGDPPERMRSGLGVG